MTTRLEQLVKSIGTSALMYINGRLKDSNQELIPLDSFWEINNGEELTLFIKHALDKSCTDGIELDVDISKRREHLEYILNVYKLCHLQLVSDVTLTPKQWDELEEVLNRFINDFNDLMTHDKVATFQSVEMELTSLNHQTYTKFFVSSSTTGKLGACISEHFFQYLAPPHESPFFSQVGKLIQDEKILVVGKQIAKHNKLLEEMLSIKPQVETLTEANLALANGNESITAASNSNTSKMELLERQFVVIKKEHVSTQEEVKSLKGELVSTQKEVKSLRGDLISTQKEVKLLREKQSDNSSNLNALTQFGFLATPAIPEASEAKISAGSKPEIL